MYNLTVLLYNLKLLDFTVALMSFPFPTSSMVPTFSPRPDTGNATLVGSTHYVVAVVHRSCFRGCSITKARRQVYETKVLFGSLGWKLKYVLDYLLALDPQQEMRDFCDLGQRAWATRFLGSSIPFTAVNKFSNPSIVAEKMSGPCLLMS